MFCEKPVMPPQVDGLPAQVMKLYRSKAKKLDDHALAGEAHSVRYYALEARKIDSSFQADANALKGVYVDLELGGKTLCEEVNAFSSGAYIEGLKELHNAAIAQLPVLKQSIVDGLCAMGFGPDPDQRGGYPREAINRHETIRSQNEKIDYLSSMLDACRQTVRRNEETIAKIDTKLERHKVKALSI